MSEQFKEQFRPDFIMIPYQVAFDKKIQPLDAKIYGIIYWLSKLALGKCTASNGYLATVAKCEIDSVTHSLLRLENKKYIKRIFSESDKDVREEIVPLITFQAIGSPTKLPGGSLDERPGGSLDKLHSNNNNKKRIASSPDDAVTQDIKTPPLGHKEIIEYFHNCVKKECGSAPTINGGKDGQAVKKALYTYPISDVKKIVDFYLSSDKVEKFGYNLSVALSADTMNKWLYEEKRLR